VGITIEQFTATTEQYGALVRLSDLAEVTARHDLVGRTIYILGLQAAETYDQIIFNVLTGNLTNTYLPNNRSSHSTLISTDLVSYVDLTALDALLQNNGGRPFESGLYAFVTPPNVYNGLLRDPDFKASVQFKAPENIWRGEVGQLGGFRIVRTNSPAFAAQTQAGAGTANKWYYSFAIARFCYQISDLQNLRVYVVAPGGQSDPLQQSRKIGWKFAFKSVVTNATWAYLVESAGTNSVNN
jgi:N4-gp56 family major capsid protein